MSELDWLYKGTQAFLEDRKDPNEKQREEIQFVAHLARRMVQNWEEDSIKRDLASLLEDLVDTCAFRSVYKSEKAAQLATRGDVERALSWIKEVCLDA